MQRQNPDQRGGGHGPRHEMLPIQSVDLDRGNPRIARHMEMYGEHVTEDALNLALLSDGGDESAKGTTVEKLRRSIWLHGGLVTPIVTAVPGTDPLRYICREGNTRTLIFRQYHAQYPDDVRWQYIPALVHDTLPLKEIDAIRLQTHLVGPRDWEAYAKARYLHYLRTQEYLTWEELVEYTGGRQREVEESIRAFEDMEAYYRPLVGDGSFDARKFSGFVELQSKDVKRAISEANFGLKDFAAWIHAGKLKPLWHIRELPRILKHEQAKAVFLRSNSKEALKQLERPDVVKTLLDADILQLARALSARVQRVQISELSAIREVEGARDLAEARDSLRMLLSVLRSPELMDGDQDE